MPYQVELEGKALRLDDLTLEELDGLSAPHGVRWVDLYTSPAGNGPAAAALIRFAAERLGVEAPERITPKVLFAVLRPAKDDMPEFWEGGLPKAEDPETTGSSGEPDPPEGGPLT